MYCVLVSSHVLLADLVVGLSSTTHVLCIGQFARSTRRSSGRSNLDHACIVYWSVQVLLADLVVGLTSTTHVLCIGQFARSTRRSSGRSILDHACVVYWSVRTFYSQI